MIRPTQSQQRTASRARGLAGLDDAQVGRVVRAASTAPTEAIEAVAQAVGRVSR